VALPEGEVDFYWRYFEPFILASYGDTFLYGAYDGILMQSGRTSVPIVPGSPQLGPSGFTFSFLPPLAATFRVQTSTNLDFWQTVATGTGAGATNFTDPNPTSFTQRFFRVVCP
jgi:hypothetical protein